MPIQFFQRTFPSANMVLLQGSAPILVDCGFGSAAQETVDLLHGADTHPASLQMVVNTHYHSDHVGGNHHLQTHYQVSIAAHHWDAQMINHRDPETCSAEWLDQPIEAYTVNHVLHDGDVLDTGTRQWQVIHTPGHTLGHICLYSDGLLIAGDTVHVDDVAWVNPFREGAGAIHRLLATLDKLAELPLQLSLSGHGAVTENPLERIDAARKRYQKWLDNPEKVGWHAMKRIFTYALMLVDGLPRADIAPYLLRCAWFVDYSQHVFRTPPADFVAPFLAEIERPRPAIWRDDTLYPAAEYRPPEQDWLQSVPRPRNWS